MVQTISTDNKQSGNFDSPPASSTQIRTTARTTAIEQVTSIIQEARAQQAHFRHRLEEVQRLRTRTESSDSNQPPRMEPTYPEEHLRRRIAGPPTVLNELQTAQPHNFTVRSRPERVRARTLHRTPNRPPPSTSVPNVQQAVEQLNEASSNLSSLLEQPIARLESPDSATQEYAGEAEVNRRRTKRRKLGPEGPFKGHLNGFSYGHRGQVVPGPLKMEIASCDGGLHAEAARLGREYNRENVLINDKSVYCTDSSKCNLMLRHMGETAFCLKKLVIKAPESGFTAPIQEGMIFVSMEADGLLARTSQYQLRDARPLEEPDDLQGSHPPGTARENGSGPAGGSITSISYRPTSRRRDSSGDRVVPPPISDAMPRSLRYNNEATSTRSSNNPFPIDLDFQTPPSPPTTTPAEPSDFAVTTTCDAPSSDEEEPSSAATLADLYRRDHMPTPDDVPSSDSDSEDNFETAIRRAREVGGVSPSRIHRRHRRRAHPSRIEIVDAGGEGKEVLQPHARFFIEKERSVVSIKFDPPV